MALSQDVTLADNFGETRTFSLAYAKVDYLAGNRAGLAADIGVYKGKNGRHLTTVRVEFVPIMAGENFIAQAYTAAKLLPMFASAADV